MSYPVCYESLIRTGILTVQPSDGLAEKIAADIIRESEKQDEELKFKVEDSFQKIIS